MAERMIKFRLVSYFVETKDSAGNPRLSERTANFGEVVDIPREEDLNRLDTLGAFFTAKERKAIEAGEYTGPEAANLGLEAPTLPTGGDAGLVASDVFDAHNASADEIADHITAEKLNVSETVALAGDNPETAERVLDAEDLVAGQNQTDARAGVEKGLQSIIDKANQ